MDLRKDIAVIVFDFDGTLFHLDVDWVRLKEALAIQPDGPPLGETIQRYNHEEHPDLAKVTEAELAAVGDKRLGEDVVTLLRRLGERYKLAILTRNSREAVLKTLATTPFSDGKGLFIVGREDAKNLKPHTEGLELILEQYGCTPEQVVVIGDTYHDVAVAQQAGALSVIVVNPSLSNKPGGADMYIDNLSELLEIL